MEKSGNIISRNKGKIALLTSLGAAVLVGPKAWHALDEALDPKSLIVTGAPGQVENHSTDTYCGVSIKNLCYRYDTAYYLGIEQCPADIEAAKAGEQTTSFNPAVGVRNEDCNYDHVRVSGSTWQRYPAGSTITFEGPVGQPLEK